ncbi:GDSL-type esterase/lipase family protein [Corynebacterium sp. TAE3-ERU2]|uniref:GDSL-type esterase/lipase family protein n=1 Tax=Corynebacterium sp. TAE3-ERU2 TaxID=2849497 RepID=UPI001C47947F|nr:GDSL-type esterase/lipase family protein [Corynebacterium sp. TAE3-ERU2]MBV7301379.1 esterase [Corynebacterium sp. TAE3-ERU2]
MRRFSSSILKATVAAVTVATIGLGSANVASAQLPQLPPLPEVPQIPGLPAAPALPPAPGLPFQPVHSGEKEMVTFGDSFTANAGKGGPRGLAPAQSPLVPNCATDMDNWPKTAARDLGYSLADWSCNGTGGAPVIQLRAYLELAIQQGSIGPGTKEVAMMYGGLDTLQWVDAGMDMANIPTPDSTLFRETMRETANRIRQVAPNARVSLVSYPEFATNDQVCLYNEQHVLHPIATPGATQVQEKFRDSLRNAAHFAGMNFVDIYPESIGHGTCAPRNEDRWVAGVADPVIGPLPNHPTVQGTKAMGHIVANKLR